MWILNSSTKFLKINKILTQKNMIRMDTKVETFSPPLFNVVTLLLFIKFISPSINTIITQGLACFPTWSHWQLKWTVFDDMDIHKFRKQHFRKKWVIGSECKWQHWVTYPTIDLFESWINVKVFCLSYTCLLHIF